MLVLSHPYPQFFFRIRRHFFFDGDNRLPVVKTSGIISIGRTLGYQIPPGQPCLPAFFGIELLQRTYGKIIPDQQHFTGHGFIQGHDFLHQGYFTFIKNDMGHIRRLGD